MLDLDKTETLSLLVTDCSVWMSGMHLVLDGITLSLKEEVGSLGSTLGCNIIIGRASDLHDMECHLSDSAGCPAMTLSGQGQPGFSCLCPGNL